MFQSFVSINGRQVSVSKALEMKAIEGEILRAKIKEGKPLDEAKQEAIKESVKIVDDIDTKQKEIEAEMQTGLVCPSGIKQPNMYVNEQERIKKQLVDAGIKPHHKLCLRSLQALCDKHGIKY